MEKDYMILPVEIKSIEIKQDEDGEEYAFVDGYAAFYNNIDLGRDRIIPGFFLDDLKKRGNKRPALWQHNSREPVGVNIYTDTENGLLFTAKMPTSDTFVTGRVLPQIKVGSIQGASIGYTIDKSKYNEVETCRDLIKGTIEESSFVTFPMNPKACIFSVRKYMKSEKKENKYIDDFARNVGIQEIKTVTPYKDYNMADENLKWDKLKSVNDIKMHTGSEENPSGRYKNGFMYYDSENAENFTAYKLPYVYWIDGEFKAIPRAIFAITAAIAGARGGVNIPDEEKEKIKIQLNKYYKKMGREEPFKNGKTFIDMDTFKNMEKRDIEKIFDEDIILSTRVKKWISDNLIFSEKTNVVEKSDIVEKRSLLDELRVENQKYKK